MLMQEHIKDHVTDMKAIQLAPGLVPNDQVSLPNHPNLSAPVNPAEMPVQSGNEPSKPTVGQQTAPMATVRKQLPSPANPSPLKVIAKKKKSATIKLTKGVKNGK
jgi:hypothetical protein